VHSLRSAKTTKEERAKILRRLHEAASATVDDLTAAMIESTAASLSSHLAREIGHQRVSRCRTGAGEIPWTRHWDKTTVTMEPVGVAGLITAWNAECAVHLPQAGLGRRAGCTVVIKRAS